jgi:hypothetical protein
VLSDVASLSVESPLLLSSSFITFSLLSLPFFRTLRDMQKLCAYRKCTHTGTTTSLVS